MIDKIDDAVLESENRYHENQPDVPMLSAEDMKKFMDYITRYVVIPKINEVIDGTYEKSETYTKDEADAMLIALAADIENKLSKNAPAYTGTLSCTHTETDDGSDYAEFSYKDEYRRMNDFIIRPYRGGTSYTRGIEICGNAPIYVTGTVRELKATSVENDYLDYDTDHEFVIGKNANTSHGIALGADDWRGGYVKLWDEHTQHYYDLYVEDGQLVVELHQN